MPIKAIGTVEEKKVSAPRKYAPKTKLLVHGYEHGRKLHHVINHTIFNEDGTVKWENPSNGSSIVIEDEVTVGELEAIGVNVADWLDRKLVMLYNKQTPWIQEVEEMPLPKDFGERAIRE